MLKQVSLVIKNSENPFKELAQRHDAKIAITDCKDFNSNGMALVLEVEGPDAAELMSEIKKAPSVRRVYWASNNSSGRHHKILAMVMVDTPVFCGAAQYSGVLCNTCPFNCEADKCEWKLLVKDPTGLARLMDKLGSKGLRAEVKEIAGPSSNELLTRRQKDILLAANELGYFEFPRRIDLTELASKLSIRAPTLSEILRRAERKLTKKYATEAAMT